jgi:hypothetical protein
LAQYYYTVAALPMLSFDEKPDIDSEHFLDFCKTTMEEHDFSILSQSKGNNTSPPTEKDPQVLREWKKRERAIRNSMAVLRGQKKNIDAEAYLRQADFYMYADDQAKEFFQAATPLEGEMSIIREQWKFIDEQEVGHIFDIDALLCYYLKLQLLERKMKMDHDRGKERFEKLYERIRNKGPKEYKEGTGE